MLKGYKYLYGGATRNVVYISEPRELSDLTKERFSLFRERLTGLPEVSLKGTRITETMTKENSDALVSDAVVRLHFRGADLSVALTRGCDPYDYEGVTGNKQVPSDLNSRTMIDISENRKKRGGFIEFLQSGFGPFGFLVQYHLKDEEFGGVAEQFLEMYRSNEAVAV